MKPRFGEVSLDILTDILSNLNNRNKSNLENVSDLSGCLKESRIVECVFHVCEELGLNPAVGYQAIEILERFMAKYIEDLIRSRKSRGASSEEELIFQTLKQKFFLSVFSSVQIASKLDLYSNVVNNDIAMRFLQAAGYPSSKQQLLDSEILILKTLHFNLNVPNPLTYVETLLEVLGHNDASVPVSELHQLCVRVLHFIYLQRKTIYSSLLISATGCSSPSQEQRCRRLFRIPISAAVLTFLKSQVCVGERGLHAAGSWSYCCGRLHSSQLIMGEGSGGADRNNRHFRPEHRGVCLCRPHAHHQDHIRLMLSCAEDRNMTPLQLEYR